MPRKKSPPKPKSESFEDWYRRRNPEFIVAPYQATILRRLEQLAKRTGRRKLAITLPPGDSKSTICTLNFVPWYLSQFPTHAVLTVSYADALAKRFGGKIKKSCEALGREGYPGMMPTRDSRAKNYFITEQSNEYHASGFDGPIAGNRIDCVYGTVLTQRGYVPIEHVSTKDKAATPWGWRTIEATRSAGIRPIIRLGYGGHSLRLTADHRILSETGWRKAGTLRRGDRVYGMSAMPQIVHAEMGQCKPSPQILLTGVHGQIQSRTDDGSAAQLFSMWSTTHEEWATEMLLDELCGEMDERIGGTETPTPSYLSGLPGSVSPIESNDGVLFQALQGCGPFGADGGRKQSELRGWPRIQEKVQENHFAQTAAGICAMHRVRNDEASDLPPPRRESPQRHPDEYRRSMSCVSFTISHVEECGTAPVYDIQVAEDRCFIAEGLVVHNCIIIDDPVKNRAEAESEAVMEDRFDTYRSVIRNRSKPGAIMLMVLTRYGLRDFYARVMQAEPDEWDVLTFPAENDDGTFLWEEYHGREHYELEKKDPETWWSVWMQEPRAFISRSFSPNWLMYYERGDPGSKTDPHRWTTYICCDAARGLGGASSNRTSIPVWAAGPERRVFLVDWVLDRMDPGQRADAVVRLIRKWQPARFIYEETTFVCDTFYLNERLEKEGLSQRIIPVGRKGARAHMSKGQKIEQLSEWFREGRIWLPKKLMYRQVDGHDVDLIRYFVEQEYIPYRGQDTIPFDDALDSFAMLNEPELRLEYLEAPGDRSDAENQGWGPSEGRGTWESLY